MTWKANSAKPVPFTGGPSGPSLFPGERHSIRPIHPQTIWPLTDRIGQDASKRERNKRQDATECQRIEQAGDLVLTEDSKVPSEFHRMPEIGEDGNTNGDQKPGRVGVEVLVGYSPEPNTTGRVSRGGLDVLCVSL